MRTLQAMCLKAGVYFTYVCHKTYSHEYGRAPRGGTPRVRRGGRHGLIRAFHKGINRACFDQTRIKMEVPPNPPPARLSFGIWPSVMPPGCRLPSPAHLLAACRRSSPVAEAQLIDLPRVWILLPTEEGGVAGRLRVRAISERRV